MCPFALQSLARCLGESLAFTEDVRIHLRIQAPETWISSVTESLSLRLDSIPGLVLVEEESAADLTVWVDVGRVSPPGRGVIGYSLAALIYSRSPQNLLNGLARALAPNGEADWLKAGGEGNIRLLGWVHAQGARDEIAAAYDRVIATLKEKGLTTHTPAQLPAITTTVSG